MTKDSNERLFFFLAVNFKSSVLVRFMNKNQIRQRTLEIQICLLSIDRITQIFANA